MMIEKRRATLAEHLGRGRGRRVADSLGAAKREDTPPLLWGIPDQLSIKANS